MEKVKFDFYSYKPRIRVSFALNLHTVPVVGDYIYIHPKYITEISKKMKHKDMIRDHGYEFIVTKRTKYMTSRLGEDWRIELTPVEPFEEEI